MPPVFALPWALAVLDAILAARMLRARAAAADASEELCCDAKDRDCVRCTFVNAVRGPGTNPVRVDVDTPPSIHDAVWKHTGGLCAAAVGGGRARPSRNDARRAATCREHLVRREVGGGGGTSMQRHCTRHSFSQLVRKNDENHRHVFVPLVRAPRQDAH